MKVAMRDINTSFGGFNRLIDLYYRSLRCSDPTFGLDMSRVQWIGANMCAPLGAVLYPISQKASIALSDVDYPVATILQKNGFYKSLGLAAKKRRDTNQTTIEYQRFLRTDSSEFKSYVRKHFRGKGIPDMTPALHSEFRKAIAEVFENAVFHSRTQHGIFACGQFFPQKHRLDFSIADLGIGFRRNILESTGLKLSPEAAILWALEGQNTTRLHRDGRPGGFGLKLIKEFLRLNQGSMQIVSDAGYWDFTAGKETTKRFESPFPGTVVNIEINTADTNSYCLATETDSETIF